MLHRITSVCAQQYCRLGDQPHYIWGIVSREHKTVLIYALLVLMLFFAIFT